MLAGTRKEVTGTDILTTGCIENHTVTGMHVVVWNTLFMGLPYLLTSWFQQQAKVKSSQQERRWDILIRDSGHFFSIKAFPANQILELPVGDLGIQDLMTSYSWDELAGGATMEEEQENLFSTKGLKRHMKVVRNPRWCESKQSWYQTGLTLAVMIQVPM